MAEVKKGELVEQPQNVSLEQRPAWIEVGDKTGTEEITANDIRLPRLCIAQGLSPEMDSASSSYIDGLKLYELFNDLTGEIYGREQLRFMVVARKVKHIEYDPDNRGVVLDMDVPNGDPRLQWTTGDGGERFPPAATTYIDFVSLLLKKDGSSEPIVISIKTTNKFQTKAAERLTGFIKFKNAPIYSGVYTIQSKSEKSANGPFGVFAIGQAGFVQNEALYRSAKAFHESLAGKTIIINREPGMEDESFDTDRM
jgi:hypothetical protein